MRILTLLFLLTYSLSAVQPFMWVVWDRNSEVEVVGYKIGYGTVSGVYTDFIDVGNETEGRVPVVGQTFCAVKAYDTEGLESDWSNEVTFTPTPEKQIAQFNLGIQPVTFPTNVAGVRYTLTFRHTPGESAHTTLVVDVMQGDAGYVSAVAMPIRMSPKRYPQPKVAVNRKLINIDPTFRSKKAVNQTTGSKRGKL